MAEQSKFAGALGKLNKKPAAQKRNDKQIAEPLPVLPELTVKGGRGGKRSDPDYSPTTFFVRKETKRKAAQLLLEAANAGQDLSDLVEELLAKWVSEHSNV
jgi:hypothetical protein